MLTEVRIREVTEVGLTLLALVLLGVFAGRPTLHNVVTLAMDARHCLAEMGETGHSKHRSHGGRNTYADFSFIVNYA